MLFHYSGLLSVPVALFFLVAFVVIGFTFGEANGGFDHVTFPVEGGADDGVAFLVGALLHFADFFAVEQHFAVARGFGDKVRAGGIQRLYLQTHEECLAVLEVDVAVGQLAFALTQAFYFPALQYEPCLKFLGDVVVEARFFILRDGIVRYFVFFLGHK